MVKGLNEEVQNALFGSMDEFSPSASSSNGHLKNEKHYNAGERATETEATYEHSEEEARSSGSSGRSPFHSSQFGVHDNSPRTKDSYRYDYLFCSPSCLHKIVHVFFRNL